MFILEEERKRECLEQVLSKFIVSSLSKEDYKFVARSFVFIETYDFIVTHIQVLPPKISNVLYYPTEEDFPTEITEEIYVKYFLAKFPTLTRPLYINKCKGYYEISPSRIKETVRLVNYKEFEELEHAVKSLKLYYEDKLRKHYRKWFAEISCFPIWR